MDTLSEANGTFAIRLLKILCQENPSHNVFYSPLSISSALAMVLLGAKGNTAVQMAQALCLNTEEDIHEAFCSLLTEVNKAGTQYLLRMANRLFGRNTGDFFTTFKESCFQFYHAELEQMPFDTEESRKHINTWVSKQTEGKIQELLSSGSIADDTSLVLVNAIYFQGTWEEQFDREYTKEMPFKINQREQRPVQMMNQEDMFNIACVSELQLQVLELPYADGELSMLVLLPAEGVDLSTVEENLTFETLTAWTKPGFMTNTTVEVFLPKFKLQEQYSMESVLQHLGMVDVFQEDKVDLSAMSPKGNLFLSKFVHKSIVEVNEEGTEAAAASACVSEDCLVEEEPTSFCADHPFLFFIRHNTANSLLFCGRFSSP